MVTNASKPVGIWIRVSTEDQARGDSREHHEKRAQHYAEAKGWHVRETTQGVYARCWVPEEGPSSLERDVFPRTGSPSFGYGQNGVAHSGVNTCLGVELTDYTNLRG